MRAFPVLLSLAALGAAAFAVVATLGLSRDLRDRTATDAAVEFRLSKIEQALATGERGPAAPRPVGMSPAGASASGAASAATGSAATDGPQLAAAGRPAGAPSSPADLEKRLAEVEKRLHERDGTAGQVMDAATPIAGPAFFGSVDDAAKHLDLSAAQRADFERAVEDAKREIDVIRKAQDETGATWEKVEKETVSYQNGALSIDGSKLAAFREKVMPGRSESFGGAMRRVREEAFRRMKSSLSPEQGEKFSKAQTGGLLPGGDDALGLFTFAVSAPSIVDTPIEPAGMDAK